MINLVLRNLVSNAIKFTGENGLIELSSAIADTECIVSVKDNGVGISEENLARLFNQHQHPTTKVLQMKKAPAWTYALQRICRTERWTHLGRKPQGYGHYFLFYTAFASLNQIV
jgi:light-regulated signal transduction histidine kinase (bacteriophytochrome)